MKRPILDLLSARAPACALGTLATIIAYTVIRVAGAFNGVEPDPRGIYWTEHAGFSWRLVTSMFFGILVSLTAAQVNEERVERWLLPGIVVATVAIVVQAVVFP